MKISNILEILIGIFAGYCCCYFISMKTIGMKPEEVIERYFKALEERLRR